MRLIGYRTPGGTGIGRVEGSTLATLGSVEEFWSDPDRASTREPETTIDIDDVTLVPPVLPGARVLCVGLNYAEHVAEGTFQRPSHPAVFGRWTRSLTVSGRSAPVPSGEPGLDWEGELVAVIGRTAKDVPVDQALHAVFGYAAFNDLTARHAQHRTTQWTVGKNADRSGPMSEIVTAKEVGDPAAGLRILTCVDGEVMQDGNTADMLFSVGEILSYLSQTMTLHPGDLVATGTPSGVGYTRRPPRLLRPGDEVTVEIERVGSVRTPIVAAGGECS
jgi:2,4-diketo-3-deoxy-L-fuconate hydrolase